MPRLGSISLGCSLPVLLGLLTLEGCADDTASPAQTVGTTGGPTSTGSGTTDTDGGSFGETYEMPEVLPCCIESQCEYIDEGYCMTIGGVPRTDQLYCEDVRCDLPLGACCSPNSCYQGDSGECFAPFTFHEGESCEDACPAIGACCVDATCQLDVTQTDCEVVQGGVFGPANVCPASCDGGSSGVMTGLFGLSEGSGPPEDATTLEGGTFMTEAGQVPALIATASGFEVRDLRTNTLIHQEGMGTLFGSAAVVTFTGFLVTFGATGRTVCSWDDATNTWAFCNPAGGVFTDATVILPPPEDHIPSPSSGGLTDQPSGGGSPAADAWLDAVNSLNSVFVNRFDESKSLAGSTSIDAPAIEAVSSNRVVSAVALDREGPVLIITDGAPGQLLLHDLSSPSAPATLVGDLGIEPRKLRCLAGLCVVSNFAGTLERVTWDGRSAPAIVGEPVDVGSGPVGIDLRLEGDNIVVASTGFNDDTYTITVFDPAGTVVSNDTRAVPEGCGSPGHATWVEDGASPKVLVTCNATSNYAVIDPAAR